MSENNSFTPIPHVNPIRNTPLISNTDFAVARAPPLAHQNEKHARPEQEQGGRIRMAPKLGSEKHSSRSRAYPRLSPRALRQGLASATLRLPPQASLLAPISDHNVAVCFHLRAYPRLSPRALRGRAGAFRLSAQALLLFQICYLARASCFRNCGEGIQAAIIHCDW